MLTDDFQEMLMVDDIMQMIYIGRNTVYNLLNSGELKGFRIGHTWKISKDCLTDYVVNKTQ